MGHSRLIGLAIAATAVLAVAWAGTASAVTLTDGSGAHPGTVSGTSTEFTYQGAAGIHVVCKHANFHLHVSDNGTGSGNPSGPLTKIDCTGSGFWSWATLKNGFMRIDAAYRAYWSGGEITAQRNDGIHCVYTTNNTAIGTFTPSSQTGGTATLDINGTLPRTGGKSSVFCGSTAALKGNYIINSPDVLNID